jgi:phage gpG-like protein
MVDKIEIDTRGIFAKLATLRSGMQPEPFLRAIGLRLMGWVDKNFKAQGLETKWPRLSPSTIMNRRGGGAGAQALMNTGRLRMSFVGGATGNPKIVGKSVSVTSNVSYAPYHEFGTRPYTIKPRRSGGVLVFNTPRGTVFAREVHHPGIPKRRMTPSPGLARELALETMNAAVRKMLDRIKAPQ